MIGQKGMETSKKESIKKGRADKIFIQKVRCRDLKELLRSDGFHPIKSVTDSLGG